MSIKENAIARNEIIQESINRQNRIEAENQKRYEESYQDAQFTKEHYEFLEEKRRKYREYALTECLATSLKAIYISGLQKCMCLTEENERVANEMVDNFIKEQGGARVVLRRMKNKTYLLETLRRLVEEAEEEAEDKATEEEKDFKEVPAEQKDDMIEKMEKEEDVDAAVDLIANRISQAEEEFIKRNAEDKEKIENIVNDINDRINAVKADADTTDEVKEEIEQECHLEAKRLIGNVMGERRRTPFEYMVKEMTQSVVKDKELRETYTTESGKLDVDRIVGNVKCMYGFLEFVNTVQLCTVDESFIEKVLKGIEHLHYNVWCYTGFVFEQLVEDASKRKLLEKIDVLVDGPFVLSKRSLAISFRGSTNQRLIDVKASLMAGETILWDDNQKGMRENGAYSR